MAARPPPRDQLQRSTSLSARRHLSSTSLHCCCGRDDCVFLKKNCSVLETVEKDVHTAAQLGQALLARHEAYMADAERDRLDLTGRIERLEYDKQDLEALNATRIEENRSLLDQLESLNSTVSDSDTRIKALEASLLSSQQNVRRLEAAAARAADAERHIAVLEEEQNRLYQELRSTKDDARTHAQRFKEAQRGILDMQDQLERMEQEAREENARHAEVVGRMERQREIDKQLDLAAGRLKGSAGGKTRQEQTNGNKIIGHFVRDLLEDNANLQLGMTELKEMLMSSNDEIQSLQEQLMHHQPVPQDSASQARTLKAELGSTQGSPKLSQELHIHHHYHLSGTPKKQEVRKPRKRRQGLLPGVFAPHTPSTRSSPRPSALWGAVSSPAAPALVSPATGSATPASSRPRHSWGGGSNPCSDLSSSPGSSPSHLGSTVFDTSHADSDLMMSPTSSFDPMSPTWRSSHSKRASNASSKSFQSISMLLTDSGPTTPPGKQLTVHPFQEDTILEEDEDEDVLTQRQGQTPELVAGSTHSHDGLAVSAEYFKDDAVVHSRLLRASSHESIMSLAGGLDIHTLKSRPSQMTLRRLGGADAVVTGVTARPTLSSATGKRSDVALRDHFAGLQTPRNGSSPNLHFPPSGSSPASQGGSLALGRWVGWRPWGSGPRPTPRSSPTPTCREKDWDANRSPGINQPGAIPGFQQYWAAQRRKGAPAKVTADTVDRAALMEGLQE